MKKNYNRALKKVAYVIGIPIVIGIFIIFGSWLKYSSIVGSVPHNHSKNFDLGQYGKYVNNFIGTGGFPAWVCGHNFPGATVPFGMVRLSPETVSLFRSTKAFNTSGYYYGDNRMLGFSHTRLAGTGATDGGHFLFTPTSKRSNDIKYQDDIYHNFSHKDESAIPGYYSVKFKKENIFSELSTTERTGIHRYTFSKESSKNILVNITNTTGDKRAENGKVTINPDKNEIAGSVRTFGSFGQRYGGQKVFFVAKFDLSISGFGIWDGTKFTKNRKNSKSNEIIVSLNFDGNPSNQTINVQVGISYVSLENARLNLETEIGNLTFDEIVEKAIDKWEDKLSLIKIKSDSENDYKIFYSALYRCFQMPTVFNDVNGEYLGFDNNTHQVTDFKYYTDLSLWDTYRTIHPLFNLIAKEEQRDMMVSLVEMARQGGILPRWPSGNGYTGSMIGAPADIAITEAYLKGITDFDIEFAYTKMKDVALSSPSKEIQSSGRRGIEGYIKYGYCPDELGDKSIAKTLEYAWADYSISLLAKELGYSEDYKFFTNQAMNYKNVWNPKTQYFQSKKMDGSFVRKFDPLQLTYTDWDKEYTKGYVEGSALQWRWAVPFDSKGLISLFENKDYFVKELNDFFELSNPKLATWTPGSYYWHGNEPDIHSVYLFNDAGRSDLTQKWVRWILKNKYKNEYVGIDGNDDAGTLSAWFVLSSLGFYPIAGTDIYQLGSPLFKSATINLGEHKLQIIADNSSEENIYVKEIYLDNKILKRRWMKHSEIAKGGTIRFVMSKKPDYIN